MVARRHPYLILIPIALAIILGPDRVSSEDIAAGKHGMSGKAHLLDGMTFKGPTGEKGKKTHHEDVLRFENGTFTSVECFQFGFKGGPYSATAQGDAIHFEAETVSPTHGKMVWSGTLQGDTLDVDYNWTKVRWLWTTYREYWFKGTKVD